MTLLKMFKDKVLTPLDGHKERILALSKRLKNDEETIGGLEAEIDKHDDYIKTTAKEIYELRNLVETQAASLAASGAEITRLRAALTRALGMINDGLDTHHHG